MSAPVAEPATVETLVSDHMSLVGHIVAETLARVPAHVRRDDLMSAGMMALVQAAQAFESERGVPFSAYAGRRVRGAILDELRSVDWATRRVRRTAREIEEARTSLGARLQRQPSDAEVAEHLGISVDTIASNNEETSRAAVLSLNHATETEAGQADVPAFHSSDPTPEEALLNRERLHLLTDAIASLGAVHRKVIEDYFLAERPMAEIAADLGVSDSRISQLRAEAVTLLRGAMDLCLERDGVVPDRAGERIGVAQRRKDEYFTDVSTRYYGRLRPTGGVFAR